MQLISTEYFYKSKAKNRNKDKLVMVFKKEDGTKIRKIVTAPKIKFYVSKDEYWDELLSEEIPTEKYIPRNQVVPIECEYSQLYKKIVEYFDEPDMKKFYNDVMNSGERISSKLSKLNLDHRLHGTDINIEDYYINKYLKKNPFEENDYGLTKVFFDIEVDSSGIKGFPDPELAKCPVNATSLVDSSNKVINEYILSYDGMDSYEKFKKRIKKFTKRITEKYNNEYKVNIYIFDEEIELIQAIFDYINEVKPDFASAWNMDFDFTYLLNRIKVLGYEPEEICCPDDIPASEKSCYDKLDSGKSDTAEKNSTYCISGYTNYIDEMSLYANITKPTGKKESYSLDYIGEEETGMRKEEIEGNMKIFHFENFTKFIEYSIQDSMVLAKIDEKTSHIDLLYAIAMITRTKITKALKKTVSINNMIRYFAEERGLIKTNNRSKLYDKPDHKIPGAFVAPTANIDYVGMFIAGFFSKFIFECATDLDLSSLYPSIIRAFNISLDTFIGYLDMYVMGYNGGDFVQDYITGDLINIGTRYFNLPNINDLHDKILEERKVANA